MASLVGSDGLVHPGAELGDTGVHTGHGGSASAAAPGHDTDQGPGSTLLADQGTTRVTLRKKRQVIMLHKEQKQLRMWVLSVCAAHHAGGSSGGSSADHQVGDLAAPVLFALLVGQQGEGGLLQQGGGVGSCNTETHESL